MHSTVSPPLLVNIVGTRTGASGQVLHYQPGPAAPRVAALGAAAPGRLARSGVLVYASLRARGRCRAVAAAERPRDA